MKILLVDDDSVAPDRVSTNFSGQVVSGGTLIMGGLGSFGGSNFLSSAFHFDTPNAGAVSDVLRARSTGGNTFTLTAQNTAQGNDDFAINGDGTNNTANITTGLNVHLSDIQTVNQI